MHHVPVCKPQWQDGDSTASPEFKVDVLEPQDYYSMPRDFQIFST